MTFKPHFIDTPLSELSYYQTGGNTLGVIAPRSTNEVKDSLEWILSRRKPYFVLGGGTNSLVSDEDWDGYVISFHLMNSLKVDVSREIIEVEAGVVNTDLAVKAYGSSLGDISWMNRLPGQMGGTVRMNARCYGGEISQVVTSVTVVTKTAEIKTYTNPEAIFHGYKDTLFMTNGDLICEAVLSLKKVDEHGLSKIKEKMDFCESDRISKGQFEYPTCGCIFKNNYDPKVSVSSGLMLERSGLKEKRLGGAQVTKGHANFVYNIEATSSDILDLSFLMREEVYKKFGVWLEYEMELLGVLSEEQKSVISRSKELSNEPNKKEALMALRAEFQKMINKKTT
ncbi:UDP-N-acetylmuramate dehydrogenase [bacterium]|nr:UDP-N-acetylmuramate dehydrogenase [bacterium]